MMGWEGFLKEAAIFVVFGFIMTWMGTFFINLIRTPPILHNELTQDNAALRAIAYPQVSKEEQEKRQLVTEILQACSFSKDTKMALRRALKFDGEIRPSTTGMSPLGSRALAEIMGKGVGSGLITREGRDAVFKIRPHLQAALRFVLENEEI